MNRHLLVSRENSTRLDFFIHPIRSVDFRFGSRSMRDFQALKFLIGVFEVRDVVDARIRITFIPRVRSTRENATDGRTSERTNERCRRMRSV